MITISENGCVGCGLCIKACSLSAISLDVAKGFASIKQNKCVQCHKCIETCPQGAIRDFNDNLVFAIGTDNGSVLKQDDHFGMSGKFQIWDFSNGTMTFREERQNSRYIEDETKTHGDPKKAEQTAQVLDGVDVIVGKLMGPNISRLKNNFVPIVVRTDKLDSVIRILSENIIEIADEKAKSERKGMVLK